MSATLPYPSMSFVPLDVLTAEEMNHMSANDQYLAGLFPVSSANITDGAVTNAKLSLSNHITVNGEENQDTGMYATREDTGHQIQFQIGMGGQNRGIYDQSRGGWVLKIDENDVVSVPDDTRVLGGWYCSGRKQITAKTTDLIPFSKPNPYGVHIIASAEAVAGSPSWCDIRAVDANGNDVSLTTSHLDNGVHVLRTDSVALAYIPMDGIHVNGCCVVDSVRSATDNYRSFVWNAIGSIPLKTWVGGSRQNDNTPIYGIRIVAPVNCNIYLEVWEQDEP